MIQRTIKHHQATLSTCIRTGSVLDPTEVPFHSHTHRVVRVGQLEALERACDRQNLFITRIYIKCSKNSNTKILVDLTVASLQLKENICPDTPVKYCRQPSDARKSKSSGHIISINILSVGYFGFEDNQRAEHTITFSQ